MAELVIRLNENQQKRTWEGWLTAEMRAYYFADLAGSYQARQRGATWATLVSSSGAALTILVRLPNELAWVAPTLALLTAALSLYGLVMQFQVQATASADLHFRWNVLAGEYERLWEDMYAEDAPTRLTALDARGAELSKTGATFRYQPRRMLRWQAKVHELHGLPAPA